tara:strand:+ start:12800 stop:13621 length:822 start_codon:yes stop_codon:yes gene_type:complete
MINKLHFFGCSVTVGNELWEEAHVPDYSGMTFEQARKVRDTTHNHIIDPYNHDNSFPALTAKLLGVDFKNHGIPGISNKEIAARAIAAFPEDQYTDTIAFLQFTTHNRMVLRYKETEKDSTVGSFVIHPKATDDRLTRSQNNLLKEMFLEFFNESLLSQDDHFFMYYAAEVLRNKGISTYILWCDVQVGDWIHWDHINGTVDNTKDITIKSDVAPNYMQPVNMFIAKEYHKYNPIGKTFNDIVGDNARLPRFHYTQEAHTKIANALAERFKDV